MSTSLTHIYIENKFVLFMEYLKNIYILSSVIINITADISFNSLIHRTP